MTDRRDVNKCTSWKGESLDQVECSEDGMTPVEEGPLIGCHQQGPWMKMDMEDPSLASIPPLGIDH